MVNPTNSQAIGESWEAGTFYTFNTRDLENFSFINEKEDTESHSDTLILNEFSFNITSINNITKNYDRDSYDSYGNVASSTSSYDTEIFSNTRLRLSDMIQANYDWNYEFNTTVLTSFTCNVNLNSWFFIEPNWTLINNNFVSNFVESEIIFTLSDPFNPIIHNFTLGDVLDDAASFAILDKDTFPEINQQFVNGISRWTFTFDFSNRIYFGIFNNTIGELSYHPYETYIKTLEFEYSSGGILKEYFHRTEVKYTSLKQILIYLDEDGVTFGALPISTQDSNSAYLLSIPAILVVAIVYKNQKKKK